MDEMTAPGLALNDPVDTLPRRARDRTAEPERLVLVVRRVEDGRYLFVRWSDWPCPAMLGMDPPHPLEGFATGVATTLHARLDVHLQGEPRLGTTRRPVRMLHPYTGGGTTGWLRPVAVEVRGDPTPDALIEAAVPLTAEEAARELPTDLERALFADGAALLGEA